MSEYSRLSELTGIADDDDPMRLGAYWPVNVLMILLGAAILSIAFYNLDPEDARWAYNPWTYAIATPVALLVFSAVLSTVVSRVVEKSMQVAFMLSVIAHLILLVYAMNVVIFSRMWPDIIESFSQTRQQLERESLQAKQYHRIASTTQTGRRPEYLRYSPTQHQPTEVDLADSPAIQMARAERANLVAPVPKIERTANPHLLERKQSTPTSSPSEQAASLSRSELSAELNSRSTPQLPNFAEDRSRVEPMRPSEQASARRQSQARPSIPARSEELSARRTPASRPSISPSMRSEVATPPKLQTAKLDLERSFASAARLGSPSVQELSVPAAEAAPMTAPTMNELADRRSRSESRSMSLDAPSEVRNEPSAQLRRRATSPARRESSLEMPQPATGDTLASLPRAIAGGRTGLPSQTSLPVFGEETFAGESSADAMVVAPNAVSADRRTRSRASSSLPSLGAPQAKSWDGTPNLAGGLSGTSPSQLARSSADGLAIAEDVAGLSGAGRAIERSQLGPSSGSGPITIPSAANDSELEGASAGSGDTLAVADPTALGTEALGTEALGTKAADLRRARGGRGGASESLGSPTDQPTIDRSPLGLPSGLTRAENATGQLSMPSSDASEGVSGQEVQKSLAIASAPSPGDVVAPAMDGDEAEGANARQRLSSNTGDARRSRSDTASTTAPPPLEIDAAIGQGGMSPELNRIGDLLPRQNSLAQNLQPADLEVQRFARRDVGGPLAAGQKVELPKPAFQQRLERLQDRNPLDATSAEPETELAIERGLAFLAKHQRGDGSWRLQDFDTPVLMRSDTAATGLALLAFQGAGYTHQQFKYAEIVDKALQFLRERQTAEGDLYIPQDPASDQNARLYSHAIATIALCEAYGMTQDVELKSAAQKSLDFMVASQDPERGGWRYQPGIGSDTSVTGWFMMAFKSGQLAGLEVPPKAFELLESFINESQVSASDSHLYRYNPYALDTPQQRHGLKPTAVMTSVGLLMRLYTGWHRERPEMIRGTDYLLQNLPEHGTRENSRRDTYYWYYATQVLFHMRGERWKEWHDRLYPMLIQSQVIEGENEGSWDPASPTPDLWARYGGRLYVTTMNLLSLEVSYRHLPLYDATAK